MPPGKHADVPGAHAASERDGARRARSDEPTRAVTPRQSRAEQVLALQRQVGNRAAARLLGVGTSHAPPATAARRAPGSPQPPPFAQRLFSVRDPEGVTHDDIADRDLLSEARIAVASNLGAIEQADPDDFNGVYGNYLEHAGVFDRYAQELYDSSRDAGLFDLGSADDVVRLYLALKALVMRDVTGPPALASLRAEHPEWAGVLSGVSLEQSDDAKLATLIGNFKKNPMGFTYAAASSAWSLAGDCGSLVRTFAEIANAVFGVDPPVKPRFFNGGNGWFLPPGFTNVATNKLPNVAGGAWYFKASHVWAEWSGTVYDVLFAEIGQNGSQPAEGKYVTGRDGVKTWYFQVDGQWYRSADLPNTYRKTDAPE